MYHSGLSHTGIYPRDIPYVASARTGESSWVLGRLKIGGSSTNTIKSCFKVVATIRTMRLYSIKVGGIKTFIGNKIMSVRAYTYTPNEYSYIKVIGGLALPFSDNYVVTSVVQANKYAIMQVVGNLALGHFGIFTCTGIKGMAAAAIYRVTGALRTTAKVYIKATGNLQGIITRRFKAVGYVSKLSNSYLAVIGGLGRRSTSSIRITGTLKERYKQVFKTCGTLANNVGHYFLGVTGRLNVATFISSLHKRVNDMTGSTRWFK